MIATFDIVCPGCQESIRLRISIGHEERQEFYFVCPHCAAASSGALLTNQSRGELTGLEVDGAPAALSNTDPDFVVNVFTDLPVDADSTSMADPGGSPFLMHRSLLGDGLQAWMTSRNRFLGLCDTDWQNAQRWWGYYIRGDWKNFDRHATRYWSDTWPNDPSMLAREDAIHRTLEMFFVPLFPLRQYVRWKSEVRQPLEDRGMEAAASLSVEWCTRNSVQRAQLALFDVLDNFIQLRWALLPGVVMEFYEESGILIESEWRLMRDDYRSLRDLYIRVFEQSYRYIVLVMAFDNASKRQDPHRFPDGLTRRIHKLEGKRASDKEAILRLYRSWGAEVAHYLDREMRNAIGHAEAYHDLHTGRVVTTSQSVPYLQFVQRVATSIQVPLLCLDTLKMVKLLAAASGSST